MLTLRRKECNDLLVDLCMFSYVYVIVLINVFVGHVLLWFVGKPWFI